MLFIFILECIYEDVSSWFSLGLSQFLYTEAAVCFLFHFFLYPDFIYLMNFRGKLVFSGQISFMYHVHYTMS